MWELTMHYQNDRHEVVISTDSETATLVSEVMLFLDFDPVGIWEPTDVRADGATPERL